MGNSTYSYGDVLDSITARGVPDPRSGESGYANTLALELGTDAMADLLTERFNWKFNRQTATPFYTNSFQQDYPQLEQSAGIIGWGEDADKVDINNPMIPTPTWPMTWRRGLSRISTQVSPVAPAGWQLCWMYNKDLGWGKWPGPDVTFYPLVTSGVVQQNPLMNFIDANGNYLILTGFGTTGSTQPEAPAGSAEGYQVDDGTAVWTVVSGTSQGFRLWPLPNTTGPVYQINPYYQLDPPRITAYDQMLDPLPDSFIRHYRRALEFHCKGASPDPNLKKEFEMGYPKWLEGLRQAMKQGDREANAYALLPATSPVDSVWDYGGYRGTADQPF